jgi:hypothetical protein
MPPPCHLTAFRHAFADAMPLRHAMMRLFFDAFCHYFMIVISLIFAIDAVSPCHTLLMPPDS